MKLITFNTETQLDEIIFEDRNQSYGAYDLRTTYNARIRKAFTLAVFISLGLVFMLSQSSFKANSGTNGIVDLDTSQVWDILETPKVEPQIEPEAAKTVAKPSENQYKPVEKLEVPKKEEKPDAKSKNEIQAIATNTTGNGEVKTLEGELKGSGKGTKPIAGENIVQGEEIKTYVDEMPEFVGGEAALRKFINLNFRVPNNLEGNNIKISLVFVVNETGEVSDIKIASGASKILDEEAIRVIAKMPTWKPGKMGGRAVKVRYRIPINIRFQ